MDKNQALPEPYAEAFIWWNNNGSVQRRVARLQADRKAFQLSTYLADTKGQYLASLDRVLRWEPIVSAGEFSMPDLSKADLAAAPAAPVAAFQQECAAATKALAAPVAAPAPSDSVVMAECKKITAMFASIQAAPSEQKPIAWLRFWSGCRAPDDCDEWLEVCQEGDKGIDGSPAFPVFNSLTAPVTP